MRRRSTPRKLGSGRAGAPCLDAVALLASTHAGSYTFGMTLEDYKAVLYRQADGAWVAEIPALAGCYALMDTKQEALQELAKVFEMIAAEYREKGTPLPHDTTEVLHA